MTTVVDDAMMTETAAAALLGVRPQTLNVWRCCRRYDLPYVRVGRLIRYRRRDIERFIDRRTVGAPELATA